MDVTQENILQVWRVRVLHPFPLETFISQLQPIRKAVFAECKYLMVVSSYLKLCSALHNSVPACSCVFIKEIEIYSKSRFAVYLN